MTMTDVLQGGSDRPPVIRRFPRPSWRRTAGAVMVAVLAAVVVIFVLVEVNPFARSAPLTNVDLLVSESQVTEGDRLTWISVDDQTVSVVSDNVEVDETYTVGDGEVILQLPNPDRIFADSVVSIDREGATRQVGEADRVVVDPTSGLWLVVDSSGHTRGGVALTNTTGAWRSRVFTVPVHRQVVGATTDALVTLDGQERNRRLQLWDPQLSEVIADLGDVTGVLDVQADSIL
ncbi:MAG TPA: hypothetical protein VMT88_07905, partial [Actinomycetes bacterium]|nr:hypothetical protein [Actinomycetes bacterium]